MGCFRNRYTDHILHNIVAYQTDIIRSSCVGCSYWNQSIRAVAVQANPPCSRVGYLWRISSNHCYRYLMTVEASVLSKYGMICGEWAYGAGSMAREARLAFDQVRHVGDQDIDYGPFLYIGNDRLNLIFLQAADGLHISGAPVDDPGYPVGAPSEQPPSVNRRIQVT